MNKTRNSTENEQQHTDGKSDEVSVNSDVTHEEESEISISKTRQMLSDAELLMKEIEEMLQHCASIDSSKHRQQSVIQQVCEANIVEDGETLVIEGFRFESAENKDELKKLSSQAGAEKCEGNTNRVSGFLAQCHQNKKTKKGKGGRQKAKK